MAVKVRALNWPVRFILNRSVKMEPLLSKSGMYSRESPSKTELCTPMPSWRCRVFCTLVYRGQSTVVMVGSLEAVASKIWDAKNIKMSQREQILSVKDSSSHFMHRLVYRPCHDENKGSKEAIRPHVLQLNTVYLTIGTKLVIYFSIPDQDVRVTTKPEKFYSTVPDRYKARNAITNNALQAVQTWQNLLFPLLSRV